MTLGTAIRLGQMIEFQKEAALPLDPLERHCSRGLFWAIFMVGRSVPLRTVFSFLSYSPGKAHADLDTLPPHLGDH